MPASVPTSEEFAALEQRVAALEQSAPAPDPDPEPTPVPEPPAEVAYWRGINVAGGEFGHSASGLPGTHGKHYQYPQTPLLTFLRKRGHRLVRIPFRWERIQHALGGPLDPTGFGELKAAVERAAAAGLYVLLDMHNYARFTRLDEVEVKFGDAALTRAHFADVWAKLVGALAGQPAIVGWGLMNEPHDLPAGAWEAYSQAAVTAIRDTGDIRDIYVCGNQWGGAHSWARNHGAAWISDSAGRDRTVYEAHQYLDPDFSGTYEDVTYESANLAARAAGYPNLPARIVDCLNVFIDWCKANGVRGFIGEMGWPNHESVQEWNAVGEAAYARLDQAGMGVTYWATGEWWGAYNQNPYDSGSLTVKPQAAVIEAHPSTGWPYR